MNFPIVEVHLEGMRQTIRHAFTQQQMSMSAELKIALERECTPEKVQSYIDETTRQVVRESVEEAVKYWWRTSEEGQALIREAVAAKMDEEAKWYRKESK